MKSYLVSEHEAAVQNVLGAVYRRQGHNFVAVPAVGDIADTTADADSVEQFVRVETFRRLLAYVFQDGPDPARTMRRMYAIAKAYSPELLLNMSDAEIGLIFAETRAAVSWRRDRIVTKKLEAAGAHGTHVRCQKTVGARAIYARAQRGNKNRTKAQALRCAA